jgi:hypothetical protein
MSLDNIQLSPVVLQELFKNTLIGTGSGKEVAAKKTVLNFLGNNKKQIAIIVSNEEVLYLPDEQLNFLMGILAACKLTMEDVAIMNIKKTNPLSYTTLTKELKAEKILLFGVEPSQIELPLQFPNYQVQSYNKQVYLSSPLLNILQDDKAEKTKLWLCLKQVFSI